MYRFGCRALVVVVVLACSALQSPKLAEAQVPWFARAGVGFGYGGLGSEVADDETNAVGYVAAWEGAFGAFVTRWLALHGTMFGHFAPRAVAKLDEGPRQREQFWVQTVGAGATLRPASGFRRARDLRPFLSASVGFAIAEDHLRTHSVLGAGAELLLGLELNLTRKLLVGLALQGSYQQKGSLHEPASAPRPFQGGHIAGLVTFAYDAGLR